MTQPFQRLRRFLAELRRRKVYRVAVTYVVVAAGAVQLVSVVIPASRLPGWSDELFLGLAVFGFPLAVVLAWAFEVTPEGVRRTKEREGEPWAGTSVPWIGLALVALAAGGVWYLGTAGDAEPLPEASSSAGPDRRSIAVLPFQNLSGSEKAQPFANGIHDDLLTRLSNLSDLTVISRTSVLPYRETELSLPAIADSLGVRWIVEGGVQQAGDQVQVNAQLIEAERDAHRWAETYRRELTTENIFAIQSELTKKIARSLETQLTARERKRVERRPTDDLGAYRLYLQGRSQLERRTEAGIRQGMTYFRQALERDSAYALAWSGLADARLLLSERGYGSPDTLRSQALSAARRALEIDPDLAEAHASLGFVHQQQHDGPAALRELRRAVELRPSYARGHHWLGWQLAALGRLEKAVREFERAVELDPLSPTIHISLSAGYSYSGRLDTALREARRTAELSTGYAGGVEYAGRVLSKMGRQEEAIAALRRVLNDMDPSPSLRAFTRSWLAVAHVQDADTARAREVLGAIEANGQYPFMAAIVHAELAEHEEAYRRIEPSRLDYTETAALRWSPVFDRMRNEERFRELMRDVNRHWGLNPDGSLPDSVGVSFDAQSDE